MIDELDVDLLTIAGHKSYAPKGSARLFVREGLELEPVIHGGGQEFGLRPGLRIRLISSAWARLVRSRPNANRTPPIACPCFAIA